MNVHFHHELEIVNKALRALANHILEQAQCAMRAVATGDKTATITVDKNDQEADRTEVHIEEQCMKLIALYSPSTTELRYIFGITKVIHELERIGDLSKKIARRADTFVTLALPSTARDIDLLSCLSLAAATKAIDAFCSNDADKARSVWEHDPALDKIHDRLQARFNDALAQPMAPVQLLLAARTIVSSLERIGDHASRIAKVALYAQYGQIMRHHPPPPPRPRVLFICQHNSARSQMAAAWLKHLFGSQFSADSAGLEPGELNPMAVEVMREVGIDISKNRTQAIFSLVKAGELFSHTITVCDKARAGYSPVFPGVTLREHWNFPDPVSFVGTPEERLHQTRALRDAIRSHVEEWVHRISQSPSSPTH